MPRLVVVEGVEQGKAFELVEGITFVGRRQSNDVALQDRTVSNRHLKVFRIGRKCYIEDLKSTNGTRVNEQRLEPGEGYEVVDGDLIRVGRVWLRLEDLPGEEPLATGMERRRPKVDGIRLIRDVSKLVRRPIRVDDFCRKVLMLVVENLPPVDTAVLAYFDPLSTGVRKKTLVSYTRPQSRGREGSRVSESVIDRVLEQGEAVRVRPTPEDASEDAEAAANQSEVRSILCVPLISNSVLRGALYVHSKTSSSGFRGEDFDALNTLAPTLALVFETALPDLGL